MCLCVIWEKSLSILLPDDTLPLWGPSEEELAIKAVEVNSEMLDLEDELGGSDSDVDEDELDAGLIERLDALDLGYSDEAE